MDKKDIKLLRKLVSKIFRESTDTTQAFLRIWEILDYLEGNKTPEFNYRIEKEYKEIIK